ncbi:MAG: hypothetical protein KBC96_13330 [Armatimonadetes bacterium]|nr:hypothetical protein [Armatimonadota bacterium]
MRALIVIALICIASVGAQASVVDVTRLKEPLVANDASKAEQNTKRIARIMESVPAGGAVYFPAGDYYFHGSARVNRGTIETTQAGQIIYGAGADVTNVIQTDGRRDFGFRCRPGLKRVPIATVRIRHKGCRMRDLSVLVDPKLPEGVIESAAIQLAHIKYRPDNQIGVIETTGRGTDFLLDFVNVTDVNVGRNLGGGIMSSRFFEVGVDIIGSGGEVKVRNMDRLDARIGVRLDNGNHCGQGGYYCDNLSMIGRHGVTSGGVFFDWVGGQAPFIRNCNALHIRGMHAGPLGSTGDRLDPTCEGEVYRRPDRTWDWITVHGHSVPDEPNPAQRTAWYGLPRQITVTRVASEARTGGAEWIEGKDFTVETDTQPGDLQHASKIHWKTQGPKPGSVYYVQFAQPKEYRVHDLQWGCIMNCQLGEALQGGPDGYALKFCDQGYGYLNPDFGFRVGYGFFITNNFVLNGPFIFDGAVDYIRMEGNTTGVCDIRIRGAAENRVASRISLSHNQFNSALIGDYVAQIKLEDNETGGIIRVEAPSYADFITIKGNTLVAPGTHAVDISGRVHNLRVQDNDVRLCDGEGIVIVGARDGFVTGNNSSTGISIKAGERLGVHDNIADYIEPK